MAISLTRIKPALPALTLAACLLCGIVVAGLSAPAQAADEVTVVVLATPSADGADARNEYSEKVNPLGKEAGIKIIKGVKVQGSLVGNLSITQYLHYIHIP